MADFVELLERANGVQIALGRDYSDVLLGAAHEIKRLRDELQEFTKLKEYAKSLGQETYLELHARNERMREGNERLGKWMSAALDDKSVCAEMKADIEAWFGSQEH